MYNIRVLGLRLFESVLKAKSRLGKYGDNSEQSDTDTDKKRVQVPVQNSEFVYSTNDEGEDNLVDANIGNFN